MPRYRTKSRRRFSPIVIAALLAAFAAAFLWGGGPPGLAVGLPAPQTISTDRETARFVHCSGPVRTDCVVDGDTFWYRGAKIRIADINTPETSEPHCEREAKLGARATLRLPSCSTPGPSASSSRTVTGTATAARYGW